MSTKQSDQPLPCRTCGYDLSGAPVQEVMVRCPECSTITPRWALTRELPARRMRIVALRASGIVFTVVVGLLAWEATRFSGGTRDTVLGSDFGILIVPCLLGAAVIAPVWAGVSSRRRVSAILWIVLSGWLINTVILAAGVLCWGLLAVNVGGFR